HFALQAGVPICPVAVTGLERLRPFSRVRVSIGPAVWPDPPGWWDFNRRVQRIVDSVRRAIIHSFQPTSRGRTRGGLRRWLGDRRRRLRRRRPPERPEPDEG
ncbi:MAG: hypothetical protein J2P45_11810, partial [Candidatus Dormibacteraeota bacterium]|nr:hypothetical protein [Candidatus Dormibacteraeota bacterium]